MKISFFHTNITICPYGIFHLVSPLIHNQYRSYIPFQRTSTRHSVKFRSQHPKHLPSESFPLSAKIDKSFVPLATESTPYRKATTRIKKRLHPRPWCFFRLIYQPIVGLFVRFRSETSYGPPALPRLRISHICFITFNILFILYYSVVFARLPADSRGRTESKIIFRA